MKTIDIDDDLYSYIASQTRHIGESASDILRRLLEKQAQKTTTAATKATTEVHPRTTATQPSLQTLLDSGALQREELSIGRFMLVLRSLYLDDPEKFTQAAEIKGSKRIYFSQDPETLKASGTTTKPKPIPDTPFWVITNTNTKRKQNMVAQLMASMSYSDEVIALACAAI